MGRLLLPSTPAQAKGMPGGVGVDLESLGRGLTETIAKLVGALPEQAWTTAYNADRQPRGGAWLADLTGVVDLSK